MQNKVVNISLQLTKTDVHICGFHIHHYLAITLVEHYVTNKTSSQMSNYCYHPLKSAGKLQSNMFTYVVALQFAS